MRRALALVLLAAAASACSVEAAPADDTSTSEINETKYRVAMGTTPAVVQAGSSAELGIRVLGPGDKPVTAFDELHTESMHVIAVSSDLKDFQHEHPTLAADGSLRLTLPFAKSQPYDVFFEYDPAVPAGAQTDRSLVRPFGALDVAPSLGSEPAYSGARALTAKSGDTAIGIAKDAHGMLMPRYPTKLRIAVKTAAGAPATDLVDWLGMKGHAILLSENRSSFIHAHAMPPGFGHGGHGGHGGHDAPPPIAPPAANVLDIDVEFPTKGLYKMFVQVKRAQTVVTVPFVLSVVEM